MILRLAEKINECLRRAADTREQADAAIDPNKKADLHDVEAHWLRVVEAYKFVEQLSRFVGDLQEARTSPTERPLDTGVPPHRVAANGASLIEALGVLVRTATERAEGEARAAFYIADGAALHHVVGMPEAYARHVDGFAISSQSLACGLAAFKGESIITRDVSEEPLWKPWLWLAKEFNYRACWSFPVRNSAQKTLGTFAMYYEEPREATPRDLELAATIAHAAALIISPSPPAQQ